MSFLKILFISLVMFFLAGFAYFAVTDVPIEQKMMTVDIPVDKPVDKSGE